MSEREKVPAVTEPVTPKSPGSAATEPGTEPTPAANRTKQRDEGGEAGSVGGGRWGHSSAHEAPPPDTW
jgi:hypothetical protein